MPVHPRIQQWYKTKNWSIFPFQEEMYHKYLDGNSGLLNAPTGSGKTFALWIPILAKAIIENQKKKGLKVIWITPIRALANDLKAAMQKAASELELDWKVVIRTGDTSSSEKANQKKNIPDALITTPESLHILLAQKAYPDYFKNLDTIVIDEWHELLGTKRGVQVELALSRIKSINQTISIWGISATIGNLEQGLEVLLGNQFHETKHCIVKAEIEKKVEVISILPEKVENFPWAGHLGIKLLEKVVPIITSGKSTLIFTNTRAQCEIWYQKLLEIEPNLAGIMAMHHSSLSNEIRNWVENALHEEIIKIVVCTSSLDLGVDFRPVETIVQIGSPKGVARFLQRAGRSGHQPGASSKIYFVPTHSLELIEGAALRQAISDRKMENRDPLFRSFDVLSQYLITLAVSEGFRSAEIFDEIKKTFSFSSISEEEFAQILEFITQGGPSLNNYQEFNKVEVEDHVFKVKNRMVALRHRLNIGTIVGNSALPIKYLSGGFIGSVEEYFISKLKPGDVFTFAGRILELVRIKDMTVLVKNANKKNNAIPSWAGGRMPLSSQLSEMIRKKLTDYIHQKINDPEIEFILPLLNKQAEISIVPADNQFLIESLFDKEGHHLFFFTFEGRYVNEGLAALISARISNVKKQSYSIAMNDYGFEILSADEIPINDALEEDLFRLENLMTDIQLGLNASEMAARKFRDIAHIAGMVFNGFPGKEKKAKHLQASSRLFFEVFREYEPNNLFFKQAYEEVRYHQLEEVRLRNVLERINQQEIVLTHINKPSPFCFPILVDRLREKISTEKLEEKINRLISGFEKDNVRTKKLA